MTTAGGRCSAALETFQNDPHWRDLILFYEYFHGDNGAGLGASHQTGWTGARRQAAAAEWRMTMKAVAVVPGQAGSVHLAQLAKPSVSDIPGGRGVLVRVLRVGVDGTDREINAAEIRPGAAGLTTSSILGHESFGRGRSRRTERAQLPAPGRLRGRHGAPSRESLYDAIGLQDMTTDERRISSAASTCATATSPSIMSRTQSTW